MGKYSMASFYLSKSLQYLSKTGTSVKKPSSGTRDNRKVITNHVSQKRSEVLFNFGLCLYQTASYEKSFMCLHQAAAKITGNPQLWYFMGLSCLKHQAAELQHRLQNPPKAHQLTNYWVTKIYPHPQRSEEEEQKSRENIAKWASRRVLLPQKPTLDD